VPELKEVECDSYEAIMRVMAEGLQNRSVGSHELNMESSRSHSVFTIHTATSDGDSVRRGKVRHLRLTHMHTHSRTHTHTHTHSVTHTHK
jgi:hypothetical protein